MQCYRFFALAVTATALLGNSIISMASDHGKHTDNDKHFDIQNSESRSTHAAHIHGIATLLIALEDSHLHMELHSPAMNLLGFEGSSANTKQRTEIENAKAILSNGERLFQFDSAKCQLLSHRIDFGHASEAAAQDHNDHDAHHPAELPHDSENHSDLTVHYRFHCEHPDQLGSLGTILFTEFPSIESLQLQWIVNDRQGAAILDNSQHHAVFR